SPLQKAVWKRNLQAVQSELESGNDFLIPNPADGSTELHYAAEFFDETIFALLVSKFKTYVNDKNATKSTPLHYAAQNGHVDAAQLLLDKGASVNAECNTKRTPLHYAALNGHVDAARLLLDKGANVNAQDIFKQTPYQLASENEHAGVKEHLLANGANLEHVNKRAAMFGANLGDDSKERDANLIALQLLLDKVASMKSSSLHVGVEDASVNPENIKATPLHVASENGQVDVAPLLLDKGAHVDAERTQLAVGDGHVGAEKLLLLKSANDVGTGGLLLDNTTQDNVFNQQTDAPVVEDLNDSTVDMVTATVKAKDPPHEIRAIVVEQRIEKKEVTANNGGCCCIIS
ncbi:UNVERIFIED_CONTAM: hypothetical protein HDU68_005052, partial [Siphonaria sp. JEL0065]